MATKNLARTVIEGGRYSHNKWERRNSSAEERVRARAYCRRAEVDPEFAEEEDIEERQHVYKGFSDKLGPMYRWLNAQDGRPWSEVRSEVFQKFDTRTTAGRHITFDHLLREVVDTESGYNQYGRIVDPNIPKENSGRRSWFYSYNAYYVDQGGIFHKSPTHEPGHRFYRYPRRVIEKEYIETSNWLNGRMIMERAGKLYWVTANDGIWKAAWIEPGIAYDQFKVQNLSYYLLDNGHHEEKRTVPPIYPGGTPYTVTWQVHGDFWNKVEHPFSFRQRGELNEADADFFRDLPPRLQEDILSFTKDR